MDDRTFVATPLQRAIGLAAASGQQFTKPIKHTAAILAAAAIGMTSGTAIAAESGVLEEIIVTATRREASLQDVAIPMTAVSGEALERAFAQDLRDLTDSAPNVQFEPVGIFQNASSFFIRGQGTGDIESAADGKVGVYVDGVVQARVSTALSDLVDVSSVEILRGPQGTLFGRNTIAGAVQILHNAPEMNEWGGEIGAQVGDFGRFDVKGVVNIPLIDDKLAGRLAFKTTNHDGYWKNSAVDKDRGAQDRVTIMPSLKWNASDKLQITMRGEWSETKDDTNMTQSHHFCRDDPANFFTNFFLPPDQQLPLDNDLVILTETLHHWVLQEGAAFTPEAFANASNAAASICGKPLGQGSVNDEWTAPNTEDRGQKYDTDVWGITLQADYDLGELGSLTYIGNYRDVEEDIIFTIDVSNHDLFAGQRITEHDQTSHELRFASGFSDKFDFVAGAYYFKQEYAMKQTSFGMLFAPNVILDPILCGTPTCATGESFGEPLLGTINAIRFTHPETFGQAQFSNQVDKSWALFTQANWHVTDSLTITAGGRYTSETKLFKHCIGVGDDGLGVSAAFDADGCNNSQAYVIDSTAPPIAPPETGVAIPTPVWQLVPAIGFDSSGGVENGCRPVLDPTGGPIFCNNRMAPPKEKWTEFTPMAGITYRFNDDMMAYFTWTKGFTAGGWNGRGVTESTIGPFDPEKATNYELGFKSDWFDHRLRFNMTAFDTEVKDFQAAFIRPAPGGGGQETIQANLGGFETEGLEFEITALPTPELTVWLNISHLKTKRLDFCTDPDGPHGVEGIEPTQGGPLSAQAPLCGTATSLTNSIGEFVGWNVPVDASEFSARGRAPAWTSSAGFAYDFNLNDLGTLTISGDWQYQSRQGVLGSRISEPDGVQQFNGDFLSHKRKASDILNASAIWRSVEDKYQVAFFMKNLTNEMYNQATTTVGGLFNFRNVNIRRHWGLELRARLGAI